MADARLGICGRPWGDEELLPCSCCPALRTQVRRLLSRRAGSRVFGTMDFFTEERVTLSERRLDALRNVGRLVSSALERVDQQVKMDLAKKDLETKVNQLMRGGQGCI